MLIAALICAASLGLLIQFFIAYCRSLITQAYSLELSEQAHQVTGIDDHHIKPGDFRRMVELVHLCPSPGTDRMQLGSVKLYYRLLHLFHSVLGQKEWIETDQKSCSYFAAIALDRRMAYNRALMASHSS